jgi:hypothetical protein
MTLQFPARFAYGRLRYTGTCLRSVPDAPTRACVVRHRSIKQTNELLGLSRTEGGRFVRKWPTRCGCRIDTCTSAACYRLAHVGSNCEELTQGTHFRVAPNNPSAAKSFLEKNRGWAGRDRAPRTRDVAGWSMVRAAWAFSCKTATVNKARAISFTHDEIKAHSQRIKDIAPEKR